MANSIGIVGLNEGLLVKPDGNGKYTIISDESRYHAIRLLVEEHGRTDLEMIRCVIIPEDEDPLRTSLRQITLKTTTRKLTSQDKLEAVSAYRELIAMAKEEGIEVKGNTSDLIAQKMDMSNAQVKKYLAISDKASEETKEALKQGDITVIDAYMKTQEEQLAKLEPENKKQAKTATPKEQAAAANTPEAIGKAISSFATFKKKAEKLGWKEIQPWIRKIERYLESVGQDNEETTMEVQP